MLEFETKLQILDLTIVFVLFIIACIIGKFVMENVADTWFAFNGPAIGIVFLGELFWGKIRKRLITKWEED